MPELSMYFTKAALHDDGTMHWAATVSDTGVDNHNERVDRAFFDNAISHAEEMDMMPYACVSHYDFAGKGVPDADWIAGPSTVMFPDGQRFKAKGNFLPTDLGKAAFTAVQNDIKNNVPHDERVRISMGFYDRTAEEEKSEATEDGSSRTVYKDGIIKHFALTRVPVLPRTEIEAWKEKSMPTKREDAASIIGDELADKLEAYNKQVGKSETEEENLVIKGDDEVEKAKRKKVDEDFEYEKEEPGKETMAEEMWTETPEEAGVPGQDQAAKRANEEELKMRKKKKSEAEEDVVEKMIRTEGNKVILYSKDGKKRLFEGEFGPGKEYKDEKAARAAAHKQEGIVQAIKSGKFRGKKSEAEDISEAEEKCEVVGGTEVEEEEVVEESQATAEEQVEQVLTEMAGRRLQGKKVEEFESWLTNMRKVVEDGETFLEWAKQTAAPVGETTGIDMPIENPAIPILEGAPAAMADFDDRMTKFAEDAYNAVTEKDAEVAQKALYDIADAIKAEIEASMAEMSDSETEPEERVEVEEVQQSATTPLDVFNIKVKSVLESGELDRRGKLLACQDALGDLGGWMQKAIIQETPPSMGDIREVIVSAVNEGTRPLIQENAALKAELEEVKRKIEGQQTWETPVRKSMYRSEGEPAEPKESYSAREVARMTTPPGVIY